MAKRCLSEPAICKNRGLMILSIVGRLHYKNNETCQFFRLDLPRSDLNRDSFKLFPTYFLWYNEGRVYVGEMGNVRGGSFKAE